jgi:hypothetical protein
MFDEKALTSISSGCNVGLLYWYLVFQPGIAFSQAKPVYIIKLILPRIMPGLFLK